MGELLFYLASGFTCVFALLTVTSRNVFHSAIYLSMALLSIAGIYFYLDAQFLGVIQILIYVGAIITLFIFAIMLTAKIDDVSIKQFNDQVVISAIVALGLFFI
ncbi:MAG: NADH-quinone oxidoreductase subunit J, partial [Candidatus Paceibacterales bacterium]